MTYKPQFAPPLNLIELDVIGSTNDHAKGLAKSGYPHGTVVWAHQQTMGRGRQGNTWTSMPGNLFMTMIMRPDKNAALSGQLSFVTAVALAETLKEWLPPNVQIALKWPNDLLLNGKKAAGILLESEVHGVNSVGWLIIGVGVNVADAPEGAASLKDFGVTGLEAGHVLEKLAKKIKTLYDLWMKTGFDLIRLEWLRYAHNIGATINVRLPKETVSGKFIGIDASGALQLEMADGTRRDVSSGEVFVG
jgi:BirA family transcriptional regulator, biotin operon repressor / biotin---[acetyl-CoA-carboxylase] ligase